MTTMTPQETYDAWMSIINGGDRAEFDRMCEQLRSGELVMEFRDEGYLIRAADPEGESDS